MKLCAGCKQNKAKSEFYSDKKTSDGLRCYCKDCWKRRNKGWRTPINLPEQEYVINGDIAKFTIVKGNYKIDFIVDSDDAEFVSSLRWYLDGRGYVTDSKSCKGLNRILMKAQKGYLVDHINHDILDNRRANLRICKHIGNCKNRLPNKKKISSKYKGVTLSKNNWVARIMSDRKSFYLGSFKTEVEAAEAYNKAAIKHHKEFAFLNEISNVA